MSLDLQFLMSADILAALWNGLLLTVVLFVCSAFGALVIGVALAAMRIAGPRYLRLMARTYTNIVRNVPLLIVLFFIYFGTTILFPANRYPILRTPHLGDIIVVLAISLVMGGFISEVIRAGVEALSVGQMEAALATGLSSGRAYRHIVIPQLLPIILPGLSNEMVNVLKGTTFGMTIGVTELVWQAQRIESETFRGVETMTAITVIYFCLASSVIFGFRGLERLYKAPSAR